ncbi:MAG: halocarboxylic acid dehydrogenase DehI family protein, partial [Pseudomonadota bacterium]
MSHPASGPATAAPALPRLKPDPVPAIHPVAERAADEALRAVYEDTKAVLQVPWMGVVTMAFAQYPRFYAALWQGLRPLCESRDFVDASAALRAEAEAAAAPMAAPMPEAARAYLAGAPEAAAEIRRTVEIFSHGNMPYLLIASIARLLLEGQGFGHRGVAQPRAGLHGPAATGALVLVEPEEADAETAALYADIRATLGLPFVNTDYRALARWPGYFPAAWSALRPAIAEPGYEAALARVHARALALADALPNPEALGAEALQEAAVQDASLEEVRAVVRLFQWLLPGLVVNVAVFRHQLG